jgi:GT2 family glycosyltransferase
MKLSVIIPTHDRPGTLRNTLAALAGQTLPAERFEILVVDDGSDEAHRREVRSLCASGRGELIEKDQGGLASARNRGADRARGEILHFLDDDVIPVPESLEQHLASHAAAPSPVAVVGALPFPPHVKLNAFLWYIERSGHYDLYKHPGKYPGGKPPMPPMNGNSSISRELFFRIGRYDESFRQYGSEDLELGYRLARAGVRFVYNPRAVGYHDHTKDFPTFCADMETAGESLIRVYRKYPDIKAPKKIDIVEDRLRDLPRGKLPVKIIMEATFGFPWILVLPRWLLRRAEPCHGLRHLLFPLYRWVAHYHYAVGMRRALAAPVT